MDVCLIKRFSLFLDDEKERLASGRSASDGHQRQDAKVVLGISAAAQHVGRVLI